MRQLMLDEGQVVTVTSASLPIATYAKFKPQSVEFLELTNPKVILEIQLRKFSCLTKGDIIAFQYVGRMYELLVLDLKPTNAVSIVECDMNVEFDAPEGYVEPKREKKISESIPGGHELPELPEGDLPSTGSVSSFTAFSGSGNRLDGKKMSKDQATHLEKTNAVARGLYLGAPIVDYTPGTINFYRNYIRADAQKSEDDQKSFSAFGGSGKALKPKRN